MRVDAIDYAAQQICRDRKLIVHVEPSAREAGKFTITAQRRSFERKSVIRMHPGSSAVMVYDAVYQAIDELDTHLRCEELLAVFDLGLDEPINLFPIQGDDARRVAGHMLRMFMHLVRGDQTLRRRLVEMAIALSSNDDVFTIIEKKEKRAELIAAMDPADAEHLALDLMARVERLRSGAA